MGGVALAVAFLLSIAPGALARLGGTAWGLDGLPCVPLALLPWLALAGLPRGGRDGASTAGLIGCLLPPLALALAQDLGAGQPLPSTLATLGWGVLLCTGLAFASRRGGALNAALWLALVPGAALLLAARAFVGGLGDASPLARVLGASPLAWPFAALAQLRAGPVSGWAPPAGPLVVTALLVTLALLGPRRAPEEEG